MVGYYESVEWQLDNKIRCFYGNVKLNRAHWHNAVEIVYCDKGELTVVTDGRENVIHEGDILITNDKVTHSISSKSEEGRQIILIVSDRFDTFIENTKFSLQPEDGMKPRITDLVIKTVIAMQSHLKAQGEIEKSTHKCGVYSAVYSILSLLLAGSAGSSPEGAANNKDIFFKFIRLVQDRYGEGLTVKSVAMDLGVSEQLLYKLISEYTGTSFGDYLKYIRLCAAQVLLIESADSILEISLKCGYSSLSSFYKASKEQVGEPPKLYRKRNRYMSTHLEQTDLLMHNLYEFYEYR